MVVAISLNARCRGMPDRTSVANCLKYPARAEAFTLDFTEMGRPDANVTACIPLRAGPALGAATGAAAGAGAACTAPACEDP